MTRTPKISKAPMSPPSSDPAFLIFFEGLYIGNFDIPAGIYQVGVLPAAEHQFRISIAEFEIQHQGLSQILVPVGEQEIVFHDIPPGNRRWSFEVDQPSPPVPKAVPYDSGTQPNRLDPPDDDEDEAKDFRWALNLDGRDDFPEHFNSLTPQPGVLNPIIAFKNGFFYNRGLIQEVQRRREGQPLEKLGAISERIAANLETADLQPGAKVILKIDGGREIFNLLYRTDSRYLITIKNTPPQDHVTSSVLRSHFQLFYLALHTTPNKRYDLRSAASSSSVDTLLESEAFSHSELMKTDVSPFAIRKSGAPNPYRCGIGNTSTPLV